MPIPLSRIVCIEEVEVSDEMPRSAVVSGRGGRDVINALLFFQRLIKP